jgi:hypothetical protein
MRRLILALSAFFALLVSTAFAHEVRPAYLEIDQTGVQSYRIVWKQPTMGDVAVHLVPHLSNGWLEQPPSDQYAAAGFLIKTWIVHSKLAVPLEGRTITIEGLEQTITNAFVRIRLLNNRCLDTVVRPEAPSSKIALTINVPHGIPAFLLLGIQHILMGPDHLLFVLGLLLVVRDRRMLLKTVSAFTLAHSLTLAAVALGVINLSTPFLNALIALSILFVAPEALRAQQGGMSLTIRYPWIVAFAFGLLHGVGFASGLTSIGPDRKALVGALVLFNIGVEIGQLLFIGLVLALARAFRLMEIRWPRPAMLAPAYTIGILSASWTFQYGAIVFGGR